MSSDINVRPMPHLGLPVLIEDDIPGTFLDAIRRNLQLLIDAQLGWMRRDIDRCAASSRGDGSSVF